MRSQDQNRHETPREGSINFEGVCSPAPQGGLSETAGRSTPHPGVWRAAPAPGGDARPLWRLLQAAGAALPFTRIHQAVRPSVPCGSAHGGVLQCGPTQVCSGALRGRALRGAAGVGHASALWGVAAAWVCFPRSHRALGRLPPVWLAPRLRVPQCGEADWAPFALELFFAGAKRTRGRTRTRVLRPSSQAPFPLGHAGRCLLSLPALLAAVSVRGPPAGTWGVLQARAAGRATQGERGAVRKLPKSKWSRRHDSHPALRPAAALRAGYCTPASPSAAKLTPLYPQCGRLLEWGFLQGRPWVYTQPASSSVAPMEGVPARLEVALSRMTLAASRRMA